MSSTTTYAAVQHAPQRISVDRLENGVFLCQESFWFSDRAAAKSELARLCAKDGVKPYSAYVLGLSEVQSK